jgi:hypothetical protein
MADLIVVSQLRQKRKEIEAAIHELEVRIRDARADLSTINSALAIFGSGAGEPKKYLEPHYLFHSGELIRIIYDALREAPDGLDTSQLADLAMEHKGYNPEDRITRARVKHSVTNAMLRYKAKGKVIAGEMRKGVRVWRRAQSV